MERLAIDTSLFFKSIFQYSQATSWLLLNENGIVLEMNEVFSKTFGYSREDLIGKYFSIIFIEEDKAKKMPERELETVLTQMSTKDDNYVRTKDGGRIWVHGESILVKDKSNTPFIAKIIQDIQKEKNLEHELKQRNLDLQKVINDRDNFVYTASHDLRSPINNIEGLVKHLFKGCGDDKETAYIIKLIEQSIGKFRNTLNLLASIGSLQEEIKSQYEEIKIQQLLDEVLSDLEKEIIESNAEIVTDLDDISTIKFSYKNFRTVLYNLISNSIKYRATERRPKIRISSKKTTGAYDILKVDDNGLGIAPESQKRIFEFYKRVHQHVEGSGVGLGLVKRIMDEAEGKIEVESEVGKGTSFTLYFKRFR